MKRRSRRNLIVAAAACALFVCNAIAQEPCKLTAIGPANAVAVRDGRTLLLSDGRELRLAGIEVTNGSRGTLETLVAGQPLRLERLGSESLGSERDRYGRLVAIAFAGDAQANLQHQLLEQGQARVSARVGEGLRRPFERGTRGAGGPARDLGRSKFRPFVGRKC